MLEKSISRPPVKSTVIVRVEVVLVLGFVSVGDGSPMSTLVCCQARREG